MSEVQVRDAGDANSRVTDDVKERVVEWFEGHGVDEADQFLYHHYLEGNRVAVSYRGVELSDVSSMGVARTELERFDGNKIVNPTCVWIHREWIERHLY